MTMGISGSTIGAGGGGIAGTRRESSHGQLRSLTMAINLKRWWMRGIFMYTRHNRSIKDNCNMYLIRWRDRWKNSRLKIKRILNKCNISRNEVAIKRG